MTESAIKSDINDQFPTPGIDNDSQVFRDNFSTIKASLASAKTEIDQFLSHGVRSDTPTATMNGNILSSYVSMAASDFHYHITGLQVEDFDLSYKNGLYQTVQIGSDLIIGLTDFPTDTIDNYKVGKVRLHLTADLLDRHVTFMTSSALIMYNDSFPFYESNKLTIRGSSTGIATIVDIWQVNNGTSTPIIYLEYVGLFQDTSKPIFQKATIDVSGTRLLMAYNESLSSVTATANKFTVMVDGIQKPVSTVTAASTTVTLVFTSAIQKGQAVTFSYDAPLTGINAIKDSIGNKAISLLNETVENLSVIDTVSPVFQNAEVSANGTTLRLLYNELLNSTTAASTQFTVTVNGASITVDNVAISQSTVILSLGITVQLGQTVTVSYTAPLTVDNAIKDVAGNKAVDLTTRSVINNSRMDTISPVLLTAAVNANGGSFVLTYNEPLNTTTASKSDFVIDGTSAAISNVTAAASNVTLTMSPPIQSGQSITLKYVQSAGPNAIKDLADNKAANFTLPDGNISITNSSTIDTIPPMVSSTAIDATGLLLAITFNEPLKTTTAGTTAFTVTVAGNSRSISTVASLGSIVTLTLASAVQTGQPVTVNYTKPSTGNAIEDPTGNKTVDFAIASGNITNGSTVTGGGGGSDITPPVFSLANVDATGLLLILIYNEEIHATTASVNDFNVTVAGTPVTINSVAVVNGGLRLNLANPVQQGQIVKLTYNAPSGNNAIKDLAGNKAISLTNETVTNDSSVSGGGNGGSDVTPPLFDRAMVYTTDPTKVYIHYIENLDVSSVTAAAFRVTVDGVENTPVSISGTQNAIGLATNTTMLLGQTVTVSYTPPGGNNGIKDLAGNLALGLNNVAVTVDHTPNDSTPPAFQSATVSTNGLALSLLYDEKLHTTTALPKDFAVTVENIRVAVSSVSVVFGNSYVTLNLLYAIQKDHAVTVSYTNPLNGLNVIKDYQGNGAASLSPTNVVNNSTVNTGAPIIGDSPRDPTDTISLHSTNPALPYQPTFAILPNLTDTVKLYANDVYVPATYTSNGYITPDTPIGNSIAGDYSVRYSLSNIYGESGKSPATLINLPTTNGGGSGGNPPATPSNAPTLHSSNPTFPYQPTLTIPPQLSDTVKLYVNNVLVPSSYGPNTGYITPNAPVGSTSGSYSFTYTLTNSYGESGQSPSYTATLPTT